MRRGVGAASWLYNAAVTKPLVHDLGVDVSSHTENMFCVQSLVHN